VLPVVEAGLYSIHKYVVANFKAILVPAVYDLRIFFFGNNYREDNNDCDSTNKDSHNVCLKSYAKIYRGSTTGFLL
jgi:hypothetical protein